MLPLTCGQSLNRFRVTVTVNKMFVAIFCSYYLCKTIHYFLDDPRIYLAAFPISTFNKSMSRINKLTTFKN